jgi:hypothetical protein
MFASRGLGESAFVADLLDARATIGGLDFDRQIACS